MRPTKKPRLSPHGSAPNSVEHFLGSHVESSFTDEQRAYVGLCVAGLNKLARGESLRPKAGSVLSLSEDIQARFLGDTKARMHFAQSTAESAVGLYVRFGAMYPNLTPALKAMLTAGGLSGTEIALRDTCWFLRSALHGRQVTESPHLSPVATKWNFTRVHPTNIPAMPYEVWCPGEAAAKSIIRQAGYAAVALAAQPDAIEGYNPDYDIGSWDFSHARRAIVHAVRDATAAAQQTS